MHFEAAGPPSLNKDLWKQALYARILRIEFYGTIEMVLTSVALVRSARLAPRTPRGHRSVSPLWKNFLRFCDRRILGLSASAKNHSARDDRSSHAACGVPGMPRKSLVASPVVVMQALHLLQAPWQSCGSRLSYLLHSTLQVYDAVPKSRRDALRANRPRLGCLDSHGPSPLAVRLSRSCWTFSCRPCASSTS